MNFNIDLKNIDLKNITMDDIKAKLQKVEKKTWIKIGVSFGAVILFLIIYYGILNPIVNKKKAQLIDMNKKEKETKEFVKNINTAKAKIKKLKPRYDQYSTLFHSRAEVEGLYQTLSEFAGSNNLVISKIEKGKIREVSKNKHRQSWWKKSEIYQKSKGPKKVENIAYYTIPVKFEITGDFWGTLEQLNIQKC